jgi:predicted DNA-binding transcriptional regulator YafY
MLEDADSSLEEIQKRVKIEKMGSRQFSLEYFQEVGLALVKRKRLIIEYQSRSKDENTRREISPQRLIYYRDNWYLDAWCHRKNALRSFSVDAIIASELLESEAVDVDESLLDSELGSGYGIFAGKDVQWAKLRFTPEKSRWVASEVWHPNQKQHILSDGSLVLEVPYSDDRELISDILRHGNGIFVIEPPKLSSKLKEIVKSTLSLYEI